MTNTDMIIHDNPLDGLESVIQCCDLLLSIDGPAALDEGLLILVRLMRAQSHAVMDKIAG